MNTDFRPNNVISFETLLHPGGYHTPWHSHQAGQLWRITTGLLVVETASGRSVVPAQHIGWIPPGQEHAAFSGSAIDGHAIYLDPAGCEALPGETTLFEPDELTLLLDELARCRQVRYLLPMPADPRLKKVASHLMLRVDDNQTVEHYASLAGMSVRTFHRRFSAETGMNVVNWRQLARVMRAMEWLAAGKPVGWIALSCGYNSISAFIEVFRAFTGKTPGQWALKEALSVRR
ncbi:AraC family transcriptional regulator [Enterobacter ludwigii]|uniref:AraC family transcriptional regulator n=1 Tax=Enterobacter ludwigii TaxID=299767 RepID=UPI0039770D0A